MGARQVNYRVIIYVHTVELKNLVHNAKCQVLLTSVHWFQIRRMVFTIYGYGGRLAYVKRIISVQFGSLFMSKLALIGQVVSEKIFQHCGNIHVYCRGVGEDQLRSNFFQNHKSSHNFPLQITF